MYLRLSRLLLLAFAATTVFATVLPVPVALPVLAATHRQEPVPTVVPPIATTASTTDPSPAPLATTIDATAASALALRSVAAVGTGPLTAAVVSGTLALVGEGAALSALDLSVSQRPQRYSALPVGVVAQVRLVGHTAYVAHSGGLAIVNVSDPLHLRLVGTLATTNAVNSLALAADTVYLGLESGLQIVDIRDPAAPLALGFVPTSDPVRAVEPAGSLVFAITRTANGGLSRVILINVADPQQPQALVNYSANAVAVALPFAYLALDQGLVPLDLSNPTNPQLRSLITTAGAVYHLQVHASRLYLAGNGFWVADIGDLANPRLRGGVSGPVASMIVSGELAYVTLATQGQLALAVIDIADPTLPWYYQQPIVASLVRPERLGFGLVGITGTTLSLLEYAGSSTSLTLVDAVDPSQLQMHGRYTHDGAVVALYVADDLAYLGTRLLAEGREETRLQIVDVRDPSLAQVRLSDGVLTGQPFVMGDVAYLPAGESLRILDLRSPARPVFQATLSFGAGEPVVGVVVRDTTAYVAIPTGLHIVDVSNLASPQRRSLLTLPGTLIGVRLAGSLLYVVSTTQDRHTLTIVDITDPQRLRLRGSYSEQGVATQFDLANGLVTISAQAVGGNQVQVIDTRDPDLPVVRAGYSNTVDATVTGNLAFLAGSSGLQIVDLSVLGAPRLTGSVTTTGAALRVEVAEGYAFVLSSGGLQVFDVRNPDLPQLVASNSLPADDLVVVGRKVYLLMGGGVQLLWFAPSEAASIGLEGAQVEVGLDRTSYSFEPTTFGSPVRLTHRSLTPAELPATGNLVALGTAFQLTAADEVSGAAATPLRPFRIRVNYDDSITKRTAPRSLALYFWDGTTWVRAADSTVSLAFNTVTATIDRLGVWALFGQGNIMRLSMVAKSAGPPVAPRGIFGAHVEQLSDARGLREAQALGMTWLRRGIVSWKQIQPEEGGPYNWGAMAGYEAEFIAAAEAGITPIIIVGDAPRWATLVPSGCGPLKPDKYDDFSVFMAALVQRYSQAPYNIRYWEIYNEPDIDWTLISIDSGFGCWGGIADWGLYGGNRYGDMLRIVYPAIKAVDPNAQVLLGGLLLAWPEGSPQTGFPERFLRGVLEAQKGDPKLSFDILSYHGYGFYNLGERSSFDPLGGFVLGKANFIRNILAEYGRQGVPLMNTETASLCPRLTDSCRQTQADYVARIYIETLGADILNSLWYLMDTDEFYNSGLVDLTTRTPRLTYITYRATQVQLRAARSLGTVNDQPQGVTAFRFARGTHTMVAAWADNGATSNIPIPDGTVPVCKSRDGVTIACVVSGNAVAMALSGRPIYIIFLPPDSLRPTP